MLSNTVCLIIFGFWGVSEACLSLFKRVPPDPSLRDVNSRMQNIIIWTSVFSGIALASFMEMRGSSGMDFSGNRTVWQVSGLVLLFIGVVLRWNAIVTLGKYFTTNLTVQQGQKIVTDGCYRYIRHPGYTGLLLSFTGFGCAMTNRIAFVLLAVIPSATLIGRIRFEEKMLVKKFGGVYQEYRRKTKKLIPMIY